MTFCVRENTYTPRDRQIVNLARNTANALAIDVGLTLPASFDEKLLNTLDALIEASFPEGGGGKGLIAIEVVQTTLHLLWPEIVIHTQNNNLAVTLSQTTTGPETDPTTCFTIETRPLTTDELGTPDDPNQQPPPNPFPLPDQLTGDRQLPTTPPRETPPKQSPTPTPPRTPPPVAPDDRDAPSIEQPSNGDRGTAVPERERGGRFPDSRIPIPEISEPDEGVEEEEEEEEEETDIEVPDDPEGLGEGEVLDLLRQIRDEIQKQGEETRRQGVELHQDLVQELNDIDSTIEALGGEVVDVIEGTLREVDDSITGVIEAEMEEVRETIFLLGQQLSVDSGVGAIVDAIDRQTEGLGFALGTGIVDLINGVDNSLGRVVTAVDKVNEELGEQLDSGFGVVGDAIEESQKRTQEFIETAVSFADPSEITDWVCRMLKLYQDLFKSCDLFDRN